MPSQSLPDGVERWDCNYHEEEMQPFPDDGEYVRLSDLPKIEEQVRQQEIERLAALPTRFQDREELAANNGMLGVAQGWLDARRLLVKSLTGEDKMLVAAFDVEAEGRKRRLSELDQALKQVRQQVREELREALLGEEVQQRLWEADRDSNWQLLKGLTYADRQRAVIRAAFAALAALEEADRG